MPRVDSVVVAFFSILTCSSHPCQHPSLVVSCSPSRFRLILKKLCATPLNSCIHV